MTRKGRACLLSPSAIPRSNGKQPERDVCALHSLLDTNDVEGTFCEVPLQHYA